MCFWNVKEQEVRKIIPVLFIVLAFLTVSCDAEFPSPEDEFDYNFSDRIETPDAVEPSEKVNELISELKTLYNYFSKNISSDFSLRSLHTEAVSLTDSNQFGFYHNATAYGTGKNLMRRETEYVFGNCIDNEGFIQNGTEVKIAEDYDSSDNFAIISFLVNGEEIGNENYDNALVELGTAIEPFDNSPCSEISVETTSSIFEYGGASYIGTSEVTRVSRNSSLSDETDKLTFSLQGWGYKGINKVIVYNDEAVELQGSSDLAGTYRYSGFASSSDQELTEPALLI